MDDTVEIYIKCNVGLGHKVLSVYTPSESVFLYTKSSIKSIKINTVCKNQLVNQQKINLQL